MVLPTPNSVNAAVAAYAQNLRQQNPDNQGNFTMTEEGLLTHFSTPGWMDIPFVSHIPTLQSFTLSDAANQPPASVAGQAPAPDNVRYFGRECFGDFVNKFYDGECLVVSPLGGGKSHLTLAAVLYFRVRSILFPNSAVPTPRVVYIAKSCAVQGQMYGQLLGALQTSFPDDPTVVAEVFDAVTTNARVISGHVSRLRGLYNIVFVYDDFDTFLVCENQSDREMGNFLLALTEGCNWVMITSGSGFRIHYQQIRSQVGWPEYHIDPSLIDAEWAVWTQTYSLWTDTTDAAERAELEYMTGRVPLYLNEINSLRTGNETFTEALNNFAFDSSLNVFSGGKLRILLRQFIKKIVILERNALKEYIHTMKFALLQVPRALDNVSLIDYRFFIQCRGGSFKVVNGYIARALRDLMMKYGAKILEQECNVDWANLGLTSDNPSVRGFAFETYCITDFILNHNPYVVRFSGDYPHAGELTVAEGLTLYWPKKWNLRYVDFVTRQVVTTTRPRGSNPTIEKHVAINAYKVTLQPPANHDDTRGFYSAAHIGDMHAGVPAGVTALPDCARYEKVSDVLPVRHQLVWMVRGQGAPTLPALVNIHPNRLAQPVVAPPAAAAAALPINVYTQSYLLK